MNTVRRSSLAIALALVALGFPATPAQAAEIPVTTKADENGGGAGCALREAVIAANTNTAVGGCPAGVAGTDTITLPDGTFTLSIGPTGDDAAATGDLDITENVWIYGSGARQTIVNAAQLDRVFDVRGPGVAATLADLTVTGGKVTYGSGGGIDVLNANLHLVRVNITGNEVTAVDEYGGGIHTDTTQLTVVDSAITNNRSGSDSGAIDHSDGSTVGASRLTNVTISGNVAGDDGGGMYVFQPMVLDNVTITGNLAGTTNASGDGGGVNADGNLVLRNSILAGNRVNDPGADQGPDCATDLPDVITSEGYNLIGNNLECALTSGPGDQVGTSAAPIDPRLGPLADNGGPTWTHALLHGSPAIDAGNPAPPGSGGVACAVTDQRGLHRNCDIGAYELVFCDKVAVNRIGTSRKDSLVGTTAPDGFLGFHGNDRLAGKAGKDALCGGPGKDTLKGGSGKDLLLGGGGRDLCVGQAGRDKARGCETKKSL